MNALSPRPLALALSAAAVLVLATPQALAHKRTSGVVVQAEMPAKWRVGETATIRLHISGVNAFDGATVEVLEPATRRTLYSAQLARGEVRTVELPYTATRDGVQYLDILTRQAARSSVRSLAVAAGSGQVALKREGTVLTTPEGEAVVSLPAQR
jgi:methionine-rich copper-binding protein CopC